MTDGETVDIEVEEITVKDVIDHVRSKSGFVQTGVRVSIVHISRYYKKINKRN